MVDQTETLLDEAPQIEVNPKVETIYVSKDEPNENYTPLTEEQQIRSPYLGSVDLVVCLLLATPCIVGFWAATWNILDLHRDLFPTWPTFLGASAGQIMDYPLQQVLKKLVDKKTSNKPQKFLKIFCLRMYLYTMGLMAILQWRSGFELFDKFLKLKKTQNDIVHVEDSRYLIGILILMLSTLILLRSLRNAVVPPFVFLLDRKNSIVSTTTRFKCKVMYLSNLLIRCLFALYSCTVNKMAHCVKAEHKYFI